MSLIAAAGCTDDTAQPAVPAAQHTLPGAQGAPASTAPGQPPHQPMGQQPGQPNGMGGPAGAAGKAAPQRKVSDEELKIFAGAYKRVMETQGAFQARTEGVSSPEELAEIQTAANDAIKAAIKRSGMTVQDYQALIGRLNQDADLRQRLRSYLQ